MQLRFKLRHKGSTQKLHLSSLPTWSTITERIGRAFSLAPEDVGLAYKGRDNTEKLMTSREELDEYIQVHNIQNTGKTMEFDVRDSRAWSSLAASDVGGARISDDYDDMPEVSPRSPHGFTYVTQLPHRHDPFIFSETDLFGQSGFSGHSPIIQVMPLRGMDPDAFSSGFIETVPTSVENINPEITPARRDDDIQTASVTSVDEPLRFPLKDKGKGKVREREKASDLSTSGIYVDNKPTTHVPRRVEPPTPIPIPSHSHDEHVRNHSRSAGSDTPRAAHDALTDDGAPPTTMLDVGSVEAISHLSHLFGATTEFLRAYPTISQNMRDVFAGFHELDLNKEVEATRDADGKARQRIHQAEMDIAQRNLMRSALEMMRQFSKAMEPGTIDSPGDYSFPEINMPVPVPQGVTRPATYSSVADRASLPPAPPEILAGLDSRARLEAAKALYKQEKERYREERERKRKERMGRIASNAKNIHLLDPPRPPAASHSRGTVPTRIHVPERVGVYKAVNPTDHAMVDHATSAAARPVSPPNAREKEKERMREKQRKRRSEEKEKDRRPSYGRDSYDRKQNILTDYDPRPIFTPTDIKPMPGMPGMGVAYVPVPIPIPFAPSAGVPPPPPPPPVPPTAPPTKEKEGEKERGKRKEKEKEKEKAIEDGDDEETWTPFVPKFLDHNAPAAIYHQRQRSMHLSEREEERRRSMVEPQPGVRANTDSAVDINASIDPLGHHTDDDDDDDDDMDMLSTDDSEPEPPRPWTAPTFTTSSITPQFRSSPLGDAIEASVRRNPVPKMYQKVERFGEGMGAASRFVAAAGAEKRAGARYSGGFSGLPARYGYEDEADEADEADERRYIGTTTTATQTDTDTVRGAPGLLPRRNGQRF